MGEVIWLMGQWIALADIIGLWKKNVKLILKLIKLPDIKSKRRNSFECYN